ncbi:MAG TPA: hypothetical protein PLC53_03265 [Bacilli bacterium]|nr:hypothetical protein [Bacilli bacterium]
MKTKNQKIRKVTAAKIRKVTTPEVFHSFANNLNNCKSSSYFYKDNELFYKNELIATIYDKVNKIVLIKNFNHSGQYGNGYSTHHIYRCFNETWNTIRVKELYSVNVKDKANNKVKLFNHIIELNLNKLINEYYWLNEYINNPRRLSLRSDVKHLYDLQEKIKSKIKLLNIPKKYINRKANNKSILIPYYIGWHTKYEHFYNNESLRYWLDFKFTDKELDTINCKTWIFNNLYGKTIAKRLTKKQKEAIYFNIEKRTRLELVLKIERENKERIKHERLQREKEERKIKKLALLEDWLSGKYINNLWDIPIHLRLTKDNLVETTLGVTVPLNHAKLLYLKFKQCIKTNTEWISNGCSIKIGNYLVGCIKKNDIGWYLKAGCHTIYEKEIDLFINMFKLNW